MPAKLITPINNIEKKVHNDVNRDLIKKFYKYLASIDTSESYQNGLLKVIMRFAEYLAPEDTFYQIMDKEKIGKFLDLKRKTEDTDPDKKWITTWNDYLWGIKYFYRWLHNAKEKGVNANSFDNWVHLLLLISTIKR